MKKLLSLLLCAAMLISVCCVLPVTASAAGETLTVSDEYGNEITVKKGQDILYTVGLYAGPDKIINGQGYIEYTKGSLGVDLYGDFSTDDDGNLEVDFDAYSFPLVYKSSLFANPGIDGIIYFNFSAVKGIALFDDPSKVLMKFRFKALSSGTATIRTKMEYMMNTKDVKIFSDEGPDLTIKPYLKPSFEAASYIIGDSDSSWDVNIKDATLIQKVCAGTSDKYAAAASDADLDGKVTLKDSLGIRKYLAGNKPDEVGTPNYNVGVSVFKSEQ